MANHPNIGRLLSPRFQVGLVPVFLFLFVTSCSAEGKKNGGLRDIQAREIIALLDKGKHVYMDSCAIWGDLDFTKIKNRNAIAGGISMSFVEQSVTFTNCVFTGKVIAFNPTKITAVTFTKNLTFTRCDFRDEVDFTECTVEGNTFFTGSIFRKKANWQGAFFKCRNAYFDETKYDSDALFQNAVFTCDATFIHAEFSATAMFQKIRIAGLAMFGDVTFNGYADFTYAKAGEAIFNYAKFNERSDFEYSNMKP